MTSGLMNPTTIGQPAGNPRLSAIANRDAANQFQNNANKAMAGGKYRRRVGGAASGIPVAQFSLPYKEQNGPGTGINAQVAGINKINTQADAYSDYDNLAAVKKGGFRVHKYNKRSSHRKRSSSSKIGGNPNWSWGCYSGGKQKTQRKYRKSRKHYRKSRKH